MSGLVSNIKLNTHLRREPLEYIIFTKSLSTVPFHRVFYIMLVGTNFLPPRLLSLSSVCVSRFSLLSSMPVASTFVCPRIFSRKKTRSQQALFLLHAPLQLMSVISVHACTNGALGVLLRACRLVKRKSDGRKRLVCAPDL